MASLLTLPPELRQHILSLTFPETNTIDEPLLVQITTLLHLNRALRSDTAYLLTQWSPLHYFNHLKPPHQITPQTVLVNGHPVTPKLEHLCLNIFHESSLDVIYWTCQCRPVEHTDLISGFRSSIPNLPLAISSISLDITPAPAAHRKMHPLALNAMVYDRRTQNFMDNHVHHIAHLIEAIDTYYNRSIPINLTGTLGTRRQPISQPAVQQWPDVIVSQWRHISPSPNKYDTIIPFTGTLITAAQAHVTPIDEAIQRLRPKKDYAKAERKVFAKFGTIQWSPQMRWLYAKLVHDGEGDGVNGDFRALAEFEVGSEREIRFEPGSAARRAFVHKVAGDMGLVSGSIGEGMERCVVVRRGDGGRDEQKEVSDGEESAKYSSGRNWGEHVCAW